MRLVIMRHGEAEILAGRDSNRALTKQGMQEASVVGKWLSRHYEAFDLGWVSPYKRAQQTMEQVQQSGVAIRQKQTQSGFVPDGNAQQLASHIWDEVHTGQYESMLVISHMPLVAFLVEALDKGYPAPLFSTAGIAECVLDEQQCLAHCLRVAAPYELN